MNFVDILISTYNGEEYIEKQIDSLHSQSFKNINIIIRDDGSSDNTISILDSLAKKHGNIQLLLGNNIGSSNSFLKLLGYSSSNYVMLCDQDDVWLPSKVKQTLDLMLLQELQNPNISQLVFTDLIVTDKELNVIHDSMLTLMKIDVYNLIKEPLNILVQNPVAGCTLMLNSYGRKEVLDSGTIPKRVVHDHWIALIVSKNGNLSFLKEGTLLYRQHGYNQVGSSKVNLGYLIRRLFDLKNTFYHDWTLMKQLDNRGGITIFSYIVKKIVINARRLYKR